VSPSALLRVNEAELLRVNLDKPGSYLPLDATGMMALCQDFPGQCREAIDIGEAFSTPAEFSRASKVLLCGLGGSAIAGDLVGRLTADRMAVPFHVSRQYELPAWAREDTLAVLSSYSGNTEETICAFQQALCKGTLVVCITSGGRLGQLAEEKGLPLIRIPPGRPPRAATGFLIFPLLSLLEKAGLTSPLEEEKKEALSLLEEMSAQFSPHRPAAENEAKALALWLKGKFPLIYGWGHLAPVAFRWQTQLNENSKALAHSGELPEMNHNEVVAWAHRSEMAERLAVILLRCEEEPPRLRARFELTKRIISDHAALRECWSRGRSRLACQLSLLYLGDFVSLYLAFLAHKDPAEINAINFLKGELAKLPL